MFTNDQSGKIFNTQNVCKKLITAVHGNFCQFENMMYWAVKGKTCV